jgi:DNA-directed RNA polymerase subunit beta
VRYLVKLWEGADGYEVDDIDHFGNRRIRSVGELIQNQFRIGLARMERVVRERMTTQDVDEITPQSLINIRPIVARSRSSSAPRSSRSSWTRPTRSPASLTSAASRRWARAVCPASAPASRCATCTRATTAACAPSRRLKVRTSASSARSRRSRASTRYGFIETPYRKVVKGKVTDEIEYLTADVDERYIIAQATERFDPKTASSSTTACSASCSRAACPSTSSPRLSTTWT